MNLESLFTEYKPTGLLGGAASGATLGADLASKFASTDETRQRTLRDEQMLPLDMAGKLASNQKQVLDNDLQSSVQTPEYLAMNSGNAYLEAQNNSMTLQQAQKLLPFETAYKMMRQQDLTSIKAISSLASMLQQGQDQEAIKFVQQYIKSPEQKSLLENQIQAISSPEGRGKAIAELEKMATSITNRLNVTDEKTWQERWLAMLKSMTDLQQARYSQSSSPGPNPSKEMLKMHLTQKLRDAERAFSSYSLDGNNSSVVNGKKVWKNPGVAQKLYQTQEDIRAQLINISNEVSSEGFAGVQTDKQKSTAPATPRSNATSGVQNPGTPYKGELRKGN